MTRAIPWNQRRGTVAVVVALSAVGLCGYVALATDGGVLLSERQRAQAAADASAMAAASVLYQHYPKDAGQDSQGLASQAAFDEASHAGYDNDGTHSTVAVNIPPASGPYQGQAGYAEVVITYQQQRLFSSVFGSGTLPVTARAVARGAWTVPNAGIIVLAYSGRGALSDQNSGAVTDVGAPVIVDSNSHRALLDGGDGVMTAPEFDITGSYKLTGSSQMITAPVPNNILTGVHPTPDPLAYLPMPPAPPAGTMTRTSLPNGYSQYTLTPGSYSNLPSFSTGDVVLFQQASAGNGGIYYLTAGGLNSQGASLILDPATNGGMMIYNAGTGTNDQINIAGDSSGTVNLSPLTDGPYTGLTIFQARDATEDLQLTGDGSFTIYGTLYAAGALLQVTGNGTMSNIGSQYVTNDLSITGKGNVTITYNPKLMARTRIITLVE